MTPNLSPTGTRLTTPDMMLKILLYGYSSGVSSSREMEQRCQIDVAFR